MNRREQPDRAGNDSNSKLPLLNRSTLVNSAPLSRGQTTLNWAARNQGRGQSIRREGAPHRSWIREEPPPPRRGAWTSSPLSARHRRWRPRRTEAARRLGARGSGRRRRGVGTRSRRRRGRGSPCRGAGPRRAALGGTLRSVSLRLPSSLARARVYRLRGAVAARLSFLLARGGREGEDDGPRGG
jgi:hypothetical protein